ncbi:lipopolysaccharide biosynthesis protein [Oryzobacter terrae]|uniref:lipopolysaccharide biosynthesis protein n=1 Tax=Oryzobacter terrae TaxID=1620385 RepID=UPI00366D6D51
MTQVEPPRSLRVPIAWTVAGNVVYTLAQWAAVAVIAKTLGTEDVGVFALAASVTAPILVLVQMQLRIVLATDVRRTRPFADYVVVRVWGAVALVVLSLGYAVVTGRARETVVAIGLFAVAKALDAVSDVLFGYHQRLERMDVIATSQVVNGVLSVVLLTAGVLASGELLVGMLGFAAGSLLNLVGYVLPVTLRAVRAETAPSPRNPPSPGRLSLVRTALPLATVLVLSALATTVPRLVVEADLGAYSLGIFAGVSYVVLAAGNVVNSVGNAIAPRLARHHADGDVAGFLRILRFGVLFGVGLGLVGALLSWLVGGPVLSLLYTDDYAGAAGLLAALCLASAISFAASFLLGAATAAQRFRAQLPTAAASTVAAVVVSLVAIPAYGLWGAVLATAATAVVQLVGFAVVVRRITQEAS